MQMSSGGGIVESEHCCRRNHLSIPARPGIIPAFGDQFLGKFADFHRRRFGRRSLGTGIEMRVIGMAGKTLLLFLPMERGGIQKRNRLFQ